MTIGGHGHRYRTLLNLLASFFFFILLLFENVLSRLCAIIRAVIFALVFSFFDIFLVKYLETRLHCTVDHGILIHRLESRFGIKGKAVQWFRSYLENRLQYVCINGFNSSSTDVAFGVPQGSVLGPILYLLYTSPLGDIIRQHGMEFHLYTDDSQIYFSFDPSSCCLSAVHGLSHSSLFIGYLFLDVVK